jgi:hypothetical protein
MNNLFNNRIYTTAILTVLILILIIILYPCRQNTPLWVLIKLGFYIFLINISILFIHDCSMNYNYKKEKEENDTDEMINIIDGNNNHADDKVNVIPKTRSNNQELNMQTNESDSIKVGGDNSNIFSMYGV